MRAALADRRLASQDDRVSIPKHPTRPMVSSKRTAVSVAGLAVLLAWTAPPTFAQEDEDPWLDYSYLHVPAHITYFSETSLQMAASQAGLSLAYWDETQDKHQAFEAVLSPA